MKKKLLSIALGAAMVARLLAGCGSNASTTDPAASNPCLLYPSEGILWLAADKKVKKLNAQLKRFQDREPAADTSRG